MSKKVFISLPMNNRTISEIQTDMNDILQMIVSDYADIGEDIELIDTIIESSPDPDILHEPVWYLGKSIKALSDADFAVFHPEWRTARGCIIEHMVCAMYNIPYFDISMDYGDHEDDDVEDNTHDWDFVGEINAELSEQITEAEGLDDILGDEDVEDALGFEHDDVDDLVESDPDLNPYAQHGEIDIAIMDEFNENDNLVNSDILELGEYDADVR